VFSYGGPDHPWICHYATKEEIAAAEKEERLTPPENPIMMLERDDVTDAPVPGDKPPSMVPPVPGTGGGRDSSSSA